MFEQTDVEFPAGWSQNATDIVTQKYFRGELGSPPARENSLRDVVARIVDTVTAWGTADGHLDDPPEAFAAELTHLLVHQKASFNSRCGSTSGSLAFRSRPARVSSCRSTTASTRSSSGTGRKR